MKNKLYLKVVPGDWRNSSRDRRELKAVQELGYKTLVIATTKESRKKINDKVEDFDVIRIATRPFGNSKFAAIIGHVYGLLSMINTVSKIDCDFISGHNYLGVLIGYYGSCFRRKKPKIIYDSHEFELYQSKKRNSFQRLILKKIESFVLKISTINMMVTDSIADEVQNIYKLKERPLVIRNIPETGTLDSDVIARNRNEFLQNISLKNPAAILMYHGGIDRGRGIEELLDCIVNIPNVAVVIMGYAQDSGYKNYLLKMAHKLKLCDRVYFKDAVPFSELLNYIAASDIGIVLIQKTCKSFLYSLPNKLFENIQAHIPVIGSDFPEIGKIVKSYNIGITIDPSDKTALTDAVEKMISNQDLYKDFKQNLMTASNELCWQNEKEKLKRAVEAVS